MINIVVSMVCTYSSVFFSAPKSLWMVFAAMKLKDACLLLPRRQWHPIPVLLPGKSHGWRSLVGCSPWGRSESDMTERLHFHCSLSCIGKGNGNPLQCSCLENPRDKRAWWAAVYGVAQSQTRLKHLSSIGAFKIENLSSGCHIEEIL